MSDAQDTLTILAVGARLANLHRATLGDADDAARFTLVASGREALRLLRVVPFDLVAIGSEVADAPPLAFAQQLRRAKPWQKWVSVDDGDGLAADSTMTGATMAGSATSFAVDRAFEDEAAARGLGALAVLSGPDAWRDVAAVAARVRAGQPSTRVPGLDLTAASARPVGHALSKRGRSASGPG